MPDVSRHSDDKAGWFTMRQMADGLDGCVVQREDAIRCLGLGGKVWGSADPLTESQLDNSRGWLGISGWRLSVGGGMLVEGGGSMTAQLADGLTHCKRPQTEIRRSTLRF